MSTNSNDEEIKFGRIAPTIPVEDIQRAIHFYVDVLGMEKVFENGKPVGFVIVKRDLSELHLTWSKNHKSGERNVAHLMVTDAKALHDHLVRNEVRILKGLRDANYGIRGFVFADPDGNRIDVGQEIGSENE